MSSPSLSEKVLALLAQVPDDQESSEMEALVERVVLRIETQGRESYVLADGAERHEQASASEEARNFCEEIEDALAYAANAYFIGGDPRWKIVPETLAVLWQMARDVQAKDHAERRGIVIAFPEPPDSGSAA